MAALELNFVQERAEDGQLVYRLNPYARLQFPRADTRAYCVVCLAPSTSSSRMTGKEQVTSPSPDMLSGIWLLERYARLAASDACPGLNELY